MTVKREVMLNQAQSEVAGNQMSIILQWTCEEDHTIVLRHSFMWRIVFGWRTMNIWKSAMTTRSSWSLVDRQCEVNPLWDELIFFHVDLVCYLACQSLSRVTGSVIMAGSGLWSKLRCCDPVPSRTTDWFIVQQFCASIGAIWACAANCIPVGPVFI